MMKLVKKFKNGIFSIALFLGAVYACSDDFVDILPEYSLGSESFFNNESDYYEALVGAYDLLAATYVNAMLGEIASDNTLCGGEGSYDVPGFQQIDDMIHTPVNDNLQDIWNWMFAGVQRATYILEFKDKIEFTGKAQIIAEARFLRAYYNFELVKWFGPIPLTRNDIRFAVNDEQSIPRYAENEVYQFIIDDLQLAIADLAEDAPEVGRISKKAAMSLLGKAYVFNQQYAEAADIFDQVIGSNKYQLVSDFATIFEHAGENGPGSVFEVQYTDKEGASFDCLQCSEGNIAVGFNGIREWTGPLYDTGFSFNVPTQELVDAFEDGDTRKDVAILDIVAFAAKYNATYAEGYEHTGYFNRKYIARKGDTNIGDMNLTNPNNYRAIRYADVLLLAAEAHQQLGNDTKALSCLNTVRTRAFESSANNLSVTGDNLRKAIQHERRVELAGEGHRFFDLVRWGIAAEFIPGFESGKNEKFPVPIEEIQFSNGNWEQNPNY